MFTERGTMPNTDIFEIKFTVKENHSGDAFLEIEWMKQTQRHSDDGFERFL